LLKLLAEGIDSDISEGEECENILASRKPKVLLYTKFIKY